MRTILDVLRLRLEAKLSERHTARSLGVPRSTVQDYRARFRVSGLMWPLAPEIDAAALERALFTGDVRLPATNRALPDWAAIAQEKQRKGVTLPLLWHEYRSVEPTGYRYRQFAEHYRRWRMTRDPVLRQEYRAGDRTFVDYAGLTVEVVDPKTGEVRTAQIFVAALGASNYTYAEATWTQQLPDWIASHVRMLEYFGGTTALIIPDNLRSGVTYASYYEPEINATYAEMAAHYATAILPARAVHPRDKAKVETAVQIVEREMLAPMRHHRFPSLAELNEAIRERLEQRNTRPFQKRPGTRHSLFEQTDRPALRPLPAQRYLSRLVVARETLWRRAPGSGGSARATLRHHDVSLDPVHPQTRAGSRARRPRDRDPSADHARECARGGVLRRPPYADRLTTRVTATLSHHRDRVTMLAQQTTDLLHRLKLPAMADALEEQRRLPDIGSLDFCA